MKKYKMLPVDESVHVKVVKLQARTQEALGRRVSINEIIEALLDYEVEMAKKDN